MINKALIQKVFSTLSLSFFLLAISGSQVFAQGADRGTPANAWGGVCTYQLSQDAVGDVATIQGFQCLIGRVLSIAVSGIGFIGFVMILVGGFQYMTSGDNTKGAEASRSTITYAVAGLVLALSAFFALNIIADFTGVRSILNFQIPNFAIPGR